VSALHDSGFEPLAHPVAKSFILDALAPTVQDNSMWQGIEAFDQVTLHDPGRSGLVRLCDLPQRLESITLGPKAVGAVTKDRFVDRFQDLSHRRLYYPVPNRGNA
jgi:hypothetical protein